MQIFVCKRLLYLPTSKKARRGNYCFNLNSIIIKMGRSTTKVMKLTALLLVVACLQVRANEVVQQITLCEKNAPIEKVFKKIEKQTGYHFLYTTQLIAGASTISIKVKNASLKEVLDLVFKDQPLDYELNEKTIVIKPCKNLRLKDKVPLPIPNSIADKNLLVNENGRADSGVNVAIKSTSKWTIIDMSGEFILGKVNKKGVLLISSVAFENGKIPKQSKKVILVNRIMVVRSLDTMQVIAYEKTFHPIVILNERMPGVNIVLLTGFTRSTMLIWIPGRKKSGVKLIPWAGIKRVL